MRDPWDNEFCVLPVGYPELLSQHDPWPLPMDRWHSDAYNVNNVDNPVPSST